MSVKKVYVDCFRAGQLLKEVELSIPVGLVPGAPLNERELEAEARDTLSRLGLAVPPYAGITYKVRR